MPSIPGQHLAGASVIDKFVGGLCDPSENFNLLVDFLGYDGWPAAYALTQISKGHKFSAATITHSSYEATFVSEVTANKIFSNAREGTLKIPGFPDFKGLVNDLKSSSLTKAQPQYSVCTPLPDGTLVVKSAIVQLWCDKNEMFKDEAVPRPYEMKTVGPWPKKYCLCS